MLNIEQIAASEELFDGHYRLLRPLSTDGATADVWLALDVNTIDNYPLYEKSVTDIDESSGLLVAIKIYRPKNALDIEGERRFREEFKIAFNCHHANLLQPTSFNIYKEIPYLVLPYCEKGSSEHFIGEKLPNNKIWKFILDVASGLNRLHTNQPQIIHQDIKPANILIDDNDNFSITDFGISAKKSVGQNEYYDDENSGTFAYMAPERFTDDSDPMPPSDIWSFGATLYEILTGTVPYGEEGGKKQLIDNTAPPSLAGLPPDLKSLIKACLQKDPQKRPTAFEIIEIAQSKQKSSKWKKPILFTLIPILLLLLGYAAYHFTTDKGKKEETVESVADYAVAVQQLSNNNTATKGFKALQALVEQKDYQSTFLMSRLYFDNSDNRDTLFYDSEWTVMRNFCDLKPDNDTAHTLLMRAFRLNDKDYVSLFQLGSDFFSGERRGCERNLGYARWCFEQAQNVLQNEAGPLANRYKESVDKVLQRTEGVSAIKP